MRDKTVFGMDVLLRNEGGIPSFSYKIMYRTHSRVSVEMIIKVKDAIHTSLPH